MTSQVKLKARILPKLPVAGLLIPKISSAYRRLSITAEAKNFEGKEEVKGGEHGS